MAAVPVPSTRKVTQLPVSDSFNNVRVSNVCNQKMKGADNTCVTQHYTMPGLIATI